MVDYDVTYTFDSKATSTGWDYVGKYYTGIQDRDSDGGWCWTDTGSVSSGTGPPSGIPCVYTETSSPVSVGDEFTMTLSSPVDASIYGLYVTCDVSLHGDADGKAYIEAYNGSTWDTLWTWSLNQTEDFQSKGPFDCTSYNNNDFKIRFRTDVQGSAYKNDFAVDNIRIYGDLKVVCSCQRIQSVQGLQSMQL